MVYVDSHVHAYEFSESEIKQILKDKNIILVSAAEDFETSIKNITLSLLYENIIPSVGIHPWKSQNVKEENLRYFEDLIKEKNIKIMGEIGLDKKFYPNTFDKQKNIFEFLLKIAKEYNLSVNLHSAGAWEEVFNYVLKYDIKKACFHWYTGPENVLREILNVGYFVGINVACLFQEKHQKILEKVELNNILTESDGPYEYRSKILHPNKLPELYNFISNMKGVDLKFLAEKIKNNLSRFIY